MADYGASPRQETVLPASGAPRTAPPRGFREPKKEKNMKRTPSVFLPVIVEMVGPVHCGMNTGDKPIVLDMFYLAQEGTPLAVQHPEVEKPME